MQGFNHIAGGIAFTGIFASFSDVNIFERPEYIGATVLFSLLPDVDHTRSFIGKVFYPVASWISKRYGHRTITHSLIFYLGFLAFLRGLEFIFGIDHAIFTIGVFAFGSHLVFDMCTRQGIPLFYPGSKRPAVLPGNPRLRLATNDLRSEAIVFLVFLSLTFFCLPLFANGFWMQYRTVFLTPDNLRREMNEKGKLLTLEYEREGTQDNGLLLEITGRGFTMYKEEKITIVPVDGTKLISFKPTTQEIKTRTVEVYQVPTDSLRRVLAGKAIKEGTVQSNLPFYTWTGVILEKSDRFEIKNSFSFQFREESPKSLNEEKILEIRESMAARRREHELKVLDYRLAVQAQKENEELAENGSEYDQGRAIRERSSLANKVRQLEPPPAPSFSIEAQQIRLLEKKELPYYSAKLTYYVL